MPTDRGYPVRLTEEQWRERLQPQEYAVLREAATERSFTGEYTDDHTEGVYACRACGLRCSPAGRSSTATAGGRRSSPRSPRTGSSPSRTARRAWSAPRSAARPAAPTSVTSSPARATTRPPTSGTASTRSACAAERHSNPVDGAATPVGGGPPAARGRLPRVRRARWTDLDPLTLHDLVRLRFDVFVVEQKCPYPGARRSRRPPDDRASLADRRPRTRRLPAGAGRIGRRSADRQGLHPGRCPGPGAGRAAHGRCPDRLPGHGVRARRPDPGDGSLYISGIRDVWPGVPPGRRPARPDAPRHHLAFLAARVTLRPPQVRAGQRSARPGRPADR